MNSHNSRRGFIASFVTWITALPFVRAITGKPKSFDFHVRIEEIGEERYRATVNCGDKQAILESPVYDELHPIQHWAHIARMGLLCEAQRAMKLLAFPQDNEKWISPFWHHFEDLKPDDGFVCVTWRPSETDIHFGTKTCTEEELLNRARAYGLVENSEEIKYTKVTCTNYPKS